MSTPMGCKRVGPRKPMKRGGSLKRTAMKRTPFKRGKVYQMKRTPLSRVGTSERAVLIRSIDTAHSRYIRARDGKCVLCGHTGTKFNPLECGHLFPRSAMNTRWDMTVNGNCHTQCHLCNGRHEIEPWHFQVWFQDRFGRQAYERVRMDAAFIRSFSMPELAGILARIGGILK